MNAWLTLTPMVLRVAQGDHAMGVWLWEGVGEGGMRVVVGEVVWHQVP